jgi:hypothetical protein
LVCDKQIGCLFLCPGLYYIMKRHVKRHVI